MQTILFAAPSPPMVGFDLEKWEGEDKLEKLEGAIDAMR